MGTLTTLGVVGNAMSFFVLLRDRGRSATSFLLQALAVADTLVLLIAVPLYVAPFVFPFTGLLAGYYATYMSLIPILWPIYLTHADVFCTEKNNASYTFHLTSLDSSIRNILEGRVLVPPRSGQRSVIDVTDL